MKAIILAAGQGTRLAPLTATIPKCLVPVRGRPILDWTLDALREAGVRDVTVVVGYRAAAIDRPGIAVRENAEYAATNMVHSLFCAEDVMAGDDVLVVYGDILFRPPLVRALARDPAPFAVAVNTRWLDWWSLRMADPLSDAETLRLDAAGHIVEIGKRPRSYAEVEGQYTGLIRIAERALPDVRGFYHAMDRTRRYDGKDFAGMFMTSFIQEVADRLMPVKAVLVDGGWLEIDSLGDLALAEREAERILGGGG